MLTLKKVWPRGAGGRVEAGKAKKRENILADADEGKQATFPFQLKKRQPRRGLAAYEAAKQPLCKRAARKAGV